MQIIKCICLIAGLMVLSTGCSNVRKAVYDKKNRSELASASKNTYARTPAAKEATVRSNLISTASQNLGTKYTYGGISPKEGFDCSGLVYYAAKSNQITLPRSSRTLAEAGPHINWKSAEPGDLIFFGEGKKVNHVGIIERKKSNELWVIHSTSSRGVISEDVLKSSYWSKRILFAIDFGSLIQ